MTCQPLVGAWSARIDLARAWPARIDLAGPWPTRIDLAGPWLEQEYTLQETPQSYTSLVLKIAMVFASSQLQHPPSIPMLIVDLVAPDTH
uniref:Uncharacterized protein n=1 Tax=Cannabis sativa TaxID=3483 RepID=A0A803NPJ8_CANSA